MQITLGLEGTRVMDIPKLSIGQNIATVNQLDKSQKICKTLIETIDRKISGSTCK